MDCPFNGNFFTTTPPIHTNSVRTPPQTLLEALSRGVELNTRESLVAAELMLLKRCLGEPSITYLEQVGFHIRHDDEVLSRQMPLRSLSTVNYKTHR